MRCIVGERRPVHGLAARACAEPRAAVTRTRVCDATPAPGCGSKDTRDTISTVRCARRRHKHNDDDDSCTLVVGGWAERGTDHTSAPKCSDAVDPQRLSNPASSTRRLPAFGFGRSGAHVGFAAARATPTAPASAAPVAQWPWPRRRQHASVLRIDCRLGGLLFVVE